MDLRETISLINNQYHTSVVVESLTAEEQGAISKFGQWLIDLGSDFDDQQGLTFSLPQKIRFFPLQFPVKQLFDRQDYADANDRAGLWLSTVVDRINNARTAALAKDPGTEFDDLNTYPAV